MFYTFTDGQSKMYFRNLDKAWEKAAQVQLHLGKDLSFCTVYECLTDRIRVQYCWKCGRSKEWEWRRPTKNHRHELAFCCTCGNNRCLEEIVVETAGDPIQTLALLFEQRYNQAFTPGNLLNAIRNERNWERWTVQQTNMYMMSLFPPGVVRCNAGVITPEFVRTYNMLIRRWMQHASPNEMRTRVLDAQAIEDTDDESDDRN